MKMKDTIRQFVKTFLSDEEFKERVQNEVDYNLKMFEDGEEGVVPRIVIHTKKMPDADWEVIPAFMANFPEDNKQEYMKAVGKKMALDVPHMNPLVVTMTSEAWVRHFSKEEEAERRADDKKVSDYDDKQEAVVVAGITIDARELNAIQMIKRTSDNKIIPYGSVNIVDSENYLLRSFMQGISDGLITKKAREEINKVKEELNIKDDEEEKLAN